ncbi:MAG TPA: hypothetical protein PLV68_11515, partial [Ilumatobacteraceae bacterium]|nr:hypothetical protein [Ilumatobacteraceae bacterium]
MDFTLIPQLGAGRGRLIRTGATVLYSAGDAAAASALIGWCRVAATSSDVMGDLFRLAASANHPAARRRYHPARQRDRDDADQPAVSLRQRLADGATHLHEVSTLELIIGDTAIDPLLSLNDGVVAADGFSLRAKATAALPWGPAPSAPDHAMAPVAESPAAAAPPPQPAGPTA